MRSGVVVAVDREVGVVSSLYEDDGMQQARQRPDSFGARLGAACMGSDHPAKSTSIAEESATLPCCLRSEAAWYGSRSTSLAASSIFHPPRARSRPIATHSLTRSAPGSSAVQPSWRGITGTQACWALRRRENQGGFVVSAWLTRRMQMTSACFGQEGLHTHFPTPFAVGRGGVASRRN